MITMPRRGAALVAALALMSGCGSGGDETTAEPTVTPSATPSTAVAPPKILTSDDLAAALPRSSQVPTASKKTGTCPGDDSCVDGTASVSFALTRPGTPAEQEKLAADEFVRDFVQVEAVALPDEPAAAARLAKYRGIAKRYDGAFDLPAEETSDTTYTPAEKGEGTLDDLSIEGWDGFIGVRDQRFANPDGEGSDPRYQVGQIHLVRGAAFVSVYVTVMSEPRGDGAADALVRQLATEYVGRLS